MDAQNRMRKANILLVNFSSVGAEIAKNLVLGGIGALTILDSTKVRGQDLGCNFFFDRNSVGQFKAISASHRLQELNKMVKLNIDTDSFKAKHEKWFDQFDIIIGTLLSRQEIVYLNGISRRCKIPFYATTCHGMYGYIFVDLIQHDSNVRTTANNIPKQVGKTSSVREILRIDKLTENDTALDNCIVRNSYKPFVELGSSPDVFIAENFPLKRKLRRMKPVLPLLLSLLEYSDVNAMETAIDKIDIDVDDLKSKAKVWAEKLTLPQHVVDDDVHYCEELARQAFTEFQPVAAVLGGCVAQDVINMLGRRENPLNNFVILNCAEGEMPIYTL